MGPKFYTISVFVLILICTNPCQPSQPVDRGGGLDALVGDAAEISVSAITYRGDAAMDRNPPEAQWVTSGTDGTLCGMLWEEARQLHRVRLDWPRRAGRVPEADELILETWLPTYTWWQGRWVVQPVEPQVQDGSYEYVFDSPVKASKLRVRVRPARSLPVGTAALEVIRQDYERLMKGRAVLNTPLAIGSRSYEHGLGTHSVGHVRVHCSQPIIRFSASVGVDNNQHTKTGKGSVVFAVEVDSEQLYRSPVLRGGQEPQRVDVAVDGATTLDLIVYDAKDGPNYDHANWADAQVTLADGAVKRLDELATLKELPVDIEGLAIPQVKVFGPKSWIWKKIRVRMEWGFAGESKQEPTSGRIKVYNGRVGAIQPLEEGAVTVDGSSSWRSAPGRGGITADILYGADDLSRADIPTSYIELVEPGQLPLKVNKAVDGSELTIGSHSYEHGLGTSPNSRVRVHCDEPIVRFTCLVGVDSTVSRRTWNISHTRFIVEVSGRESFHSQVLQAGDEPVAVDLAVHGARTIDLATNDGGNLLWGSPGNWADPTITTASGKKILLDQLPLWHNPLYRRPADRTVVTVETNRGSFSFLPSDLRTNPAIYAPDYGFFITRCGSGERAEDYVARLALNERETVRQRVRHLPEQSWQQAMEAVHGGEPLPEYPQSPFDPPMKIDVPEPPLNEAWRLGAWHLKRRCLENDDGTYKIMAYPYSPLAQESYLIVRMLDFMGMQELARQGIQHWLNEQGQTTPTGMFFDHVGCPTIKGTFDVAHGVGPGVLLWNVAEHYKLTGDRQWLRSVSDNVQAACQWIVRQRRLWTEQTTTQAGASWASGLAPPCQIGDAGDFRCWYIVNASYWAGLEECGRALSDIKHKAAKELLTEAAAYRRDILRAVDRSINSSPIMKLADGTWRSVIPLGPFVRGLATEILDPYSSGHGGPLWADIEFGALTLVDRRLLSPMDHRVDAFLDVLEDRFLCDNQFLYSLKNNYLPQCDWFDLGSQHYQHAYMVTPLIYLWRDEVPSFLRAFYNQYASEIEPGEYTFREIMPPRFSVKDKTFEEAAFLERLRCLLVMEDGDALWLAKGTPRAWLEDGKKISVADAPTFFGPIGYKIESQVNAGRIVATIQWPERKPPKLLRLRLRHPDSARLTDVTVNGRPWRDFDAEKKTVNLHGLEGEVTVKAVYCAM